MSYRNQFVPVHTVLGEQLQSTPVKRKLCKLCPNRLILHFFKISQSFCCLARFMLYCRDLQDQFLRFETETEQVQSQQARPRLKRYSLNKRDRDSCSQIFETETETRKICIFETETETRKMVETETLADLSVASIYNLDQS